MRVVAEQVLVANFECPAEPPLHEGERLFAGKRVARRLFLLKSGQGLEDIRAAAGRIEIIETSRNELDRFVDGGNHQGVVLECGPLPVLDLGVWLKRLDAPNATLVVLDSIEDPQNFGAIIRSACACGAGVACLG